MEPRWIGFRSNWLAVDMTSASCDGRSHSGAMCVVSSRGGSGIVMLIYKIKTSKLVYRLLELIVTVPVKWIQDKIIVIIRLLPQTAMTLSVFLQNNLRSKE